MTSHLSPQNTQLRVNEQTSPMGNLSKNRLESCPCKLALPTDPRVFPQLSEMWQPECPAHAATYVAALLGTRFL